jgi:hypothetical protein
MKSKLLLTALFLIPCIAFGQIMTPNLPIWDDAKMFQIMLITGQSQKAQHPELKITAPAEWIIVSGGGYTDWKEHGGAGSLLTASYPSSDLSSWTIKAKDHWETDACVIKGWAIALRVGPQVKQWSRQQLLQYMTLVTATSGKAQHPQVTANINRDFVLLGGGFDIAYFGKGNMLTDSFPASNRFIVKSKDHIESDQSTITSYAIGIRTTIPGIGRFETRQVKAGPFNQDRYPQGSAVMPKGFLLVGGGVETSDNYRDNFIPESLIKGFLKDLFGKKRNVQTGKMIWMSYPTLSNSWEAGAKEHVLPEKYAQIYVYAVGLHMRLQ